MKKLISSIETHKMFRRATYRQFGGKSSGAVGLLTPKNIGGTLVLGGLIYGANLEQAPMTGRSRFMIVPKRFDEWIGRRTYADIMRQGRGLILPSYHPTAQRVTKIMKKIIALSDLLNDKSIQWEIHVIQSNDPPNAFVIPGGKVFVFTNILPILGNDDGLLTVLSHEFAHEFARHSLERLSKQPIYSLLALALYSTGWVQLSNLVMQLVLEMPLSREMEAEADYIGLMIMSKLCFNPQELPKVWQRFTQYEQRHGSASLEWLSTHPSSKRRLENMEEWMPKLIQMRDSTCSQYSFFRDF